MAVRTDVTVDFSVNPRIVTVAAPSTDITIQDLYDTLRDIEKVPANMDDKILVSAGGKEDLGGGSTVGITLTLQDAKLAFAARGGPSFVQCKVTGGNLVAVDAAQAVIDPIQTTDFTQVVIAQSSSPTIVSQGILPNVKLDNFMFEGAATGLSYSGFVQIDGGAEAAMANTPASIGNRKYRVNITAAELNGRVCIFNFRDGTEANNIALTIVTAL